MKLLYFGIMLSRRERGDRDGRLANVCSGSLAFPLPDEVHLKGGNSHSAKSPGVHSSEWGPLLVS